MNRVFQIVSRIILIGFLVVFWLLPGCDGGSRHAKSGGLKPGLNYMQPMKWRMTYRYRIQEIKPDIPFLRTRKWSIDPAIPTVGNGTCEIWMVGPREGEEVRGVKQIFAMPEPTAITHDDDKDIDLIYYDFTPQGELPREIQASVQWEFYTFERYAYWNGMPRVTYDKNSDLYKRYTKMEDPILTNPEIKKVARKCIPEDKTDYVATAMGCYNEIVTNFTYDMNQFGFVQYFGGKALHDSSRCWYNKTGQCDEFASLMCAMLRSVGIPSRPAAGFVHGIQPLGNGDNVFTVGGHAWAEFYLPEVGWVPLDPTWGMGGSRENIDLGYSLTGFKREIPRVDYYFGKTDPYRITFFKDWNIKLTPPPKTPGAEKNEMWFVGYTDRQSGIDSVTYGWEGIESLGY